MVGRIRGAGRWDALLGALVVFGVVACGSEVNPLTPSDPDPEPDPPEPAVATQLAFQAQPADGRTNQILNAIAVEVRDDNGDVVTSSTQPITISLETNPSGASLSGTATVNAVMGVATFSDLVIDRSASYAFAADAPDLAGATSVAFDVVFAMQEVSAGFDFSCGIAMTGVTYCWGPNNYGQLGTTILGSETGVPVAVSGGHEFTTLIAGGGHACALTAAGEAYCWGNNVTGQLGDGNAPHHRHTPQPVLGGAVFTSLAAAGTHTCGVTTDGAIHCWGYNANGQLGTPTAGNETDIPVLVEGGHSFVAVTVGDSHSCGLTSGGAAYCWGGNYTGTLGDGNAGVDSDVPVAVAGGHVFTNISAGAGHTCGITDAGAAYCWGANYTGQLGNGNSSVESDVPALVSGSLIFAVLSEGGAEDNHTCAITTDGQGYCWGDNSRGQLGDGGAQDERDVPGPTAGGVAFKRLTTGGNHTCGVAVNDAVYCWGYNAEGQLGDGDVGEDQATPVRITDPLPPGS